MKELFHNKSYFCDKIVSNIVFFMVFFNFILAFINANIVSISSSIVILAQGGLFGLSVLCLLARLNNVFYTSLLVYLCIWVIFSMYFGWGVSVKPIFDIFVIPVFVMLGMQSRLSVHDLQKLTLIVLSIIFFFSFFEFFFLDSYGELFNVGSYYRNTRDWVANADGHDDAMFYMGAERPVNSGLGFTIHRISGVFLEPLSLAYVLACVPWICKKIFNRKSYLIIVLLSMFLLVLTDTRSALLLFFVFFFVINTKLRFLVTHVYLIFIPLILLMLACLVSMNMGGEMAYRLGHNTSFFGDNEFVSLLGFGVIDAIKSDSGYALFVDYLGVPGVLVLICAASYSCARKSSESVYLLCFYVFVFYTLLFGSATISAKIAPFLAYVSACLSTINIKRSKNG